MEKSKIEHCERLMRISSLLEKKEFTLRKKGLVINKTVKMIKLFDQIFCEDYYRLYPDIHGICIDYVNNSKKLVINIYDNLNIIMVLENFENGQIITERPLNSNQDLIDIMSDFYELNKD